jgi:hypothetical protein
MVESEGFQTKEVIMALVWHCYTVYCVKSLQLYKLLFHFQYKFKPNSIQAQGSRSEYYWGYLRASKLQNFFTLTYISAQTSCRMFYLYVCRPCISDFATIQPSIKGGVAISGRLDFSCGGNDVVPSQNIIILYIIIL